MTERGARRRTGPLTAGGGAPRVEPGEPTGPRALVVDDNDDVREMLKLSLSLDGWDVVEASSGEDAIAQWRAARPDVVLLDQQMSGMTGLECAASLRELSSDARIIMFTGFLDAATTDEARRLRILPLKKDDQKRLNELLGVLATQLRDSRASVS